mgnify:CR=1 FL=1
MVAPLALNRAATVRAACAWVASQRSGMQSAIRADAPGATASKTGLMARSHAEAFQKLPGVKLVAAVDANLDAARAFADKFGIGTCFGSLDEALDWGEFDAATNVTPDAVHYSTTLPLLAAGKHVLCEKPLATSHALALEMTQAAEKAGVVNMVNLTYRNVPAMQLAAEMVAEGQIGEVRHFEASYLQSWLTQPAWGDWKTESAWLWRLSTEHGSKGVLGDVGIHILDFATYVAGSDVTRLACTLKTFDKAEGNRIGEYPLDANDSALMTVELGNGAMGSVTATRFASGHLNDLILRIHGTKGGLDVRDINLKGQLSACLGDDLETGTWRKIRAPRVPSNYARFIDAIRKGSTGTPDFARGAALQQLLDAAEAADTTGCATHIA